MINHLVAVIMMATTPAPLCPASALPLGDSGLPETRTTVTITRGVTLTSIVRGTDPAPAGEINTTTRGPWRVQVLTIDPRQARGRLQATYGPDLARTETVTDLVTRAGAVAGVNASFFTFTASQLYPGTPVGLGLYRGRLLSEPTTDAAEADMLISPSRILFGKLTWTGAVSAAAPGGFSAVLDTINEPPGESAIAEITPEFGASTPAGPGTEVVLDRRGCRVRSVSPRGTTLVAGQTSLQATGTKEAALTTLTGCVKVTSSLRDAQGHRVQAGQGVYGVNGCYRLTAAGTIVVPPGSGSFFDRNPRTIAGTTRDGRIVLATIDGRQTTSVGTTMSETAAVADALGLRDAINLDGGGSTTMSVRGALTNQPSGGTQRPVGDALVWTP